MNLRSAISAHKLLILDTGPIRELATFKAVRDLGFRGLERELSILAAPDDYKKCSDFIGSFQTKLTCPGVLTELHKWIRETDPDGQSDLWSVVRDEFSRMNVVEELVTLLDLGHDLLWEFGPVDASLVTLAQRYSSQRPVILAKDEPLNRPCRKAGIEILQIYQVVSGAW